MARRAEGAGQRLREAGGDRSVRPPTPDGLIRMETPVLIEICYHRVRRETVFHLNFHLVNQQVIVLTTFYGSLPRSSWPLRQPVCDSGRLV